MEAASRWGRPGRTAAGRASSGTAMTDTSAAMCSFLSYCLVRCLGLPLGPLALITCIRACARNVSRGLDGSVEAVRAAGCRGEAGTQCQP